MYFNGGSSCGCGCSGFNPGFVQFNPCCSWGNNNNSNSNYAIILVLFILLVIVIGSRFTR